jgi:hypothetical protein
MATLDDISAFFKGKQKTVLTFVGYSGAGYEDEASMRKQADRILSEFDPAKTIVNMGATPDGIGAIYELAKRKGCVITGKAEQVEAVDTLIRPSISKTRLGADS